MDRFISTLTTGTLYFASPNQFVDIFEGAVSVQVDMGPVGPRYSEMEFPEKAFFELKRLTKVSCWHRGQASQRGRFGKQYRLQFLSTSLARHLGSYTQSLGWATRFVIHDRPT